MSRPPKPIAELKRTGKKHLTKEEIKVREEAEAKAKSGQPLAERSEVKNDKTAHKEFLRIKKLMKAIDKDDAVYTAVINRYCTLYSETFRCEQNRIRAENLVDAASEIMTEIQEKLHSVKTAEDISDITKSLERTVKSLTQLCRQISAYDGMAMSKRKMMLDIEKENAMTVSAMLRSIPKEVETPAENPIIAALMSAEEDDDEN